MLFVIALHGTYTSPATAGPGPRLVLRYYLSYDLRKRSLSMTLLYSSKRRLPKPPHARRWSLRHTVHLDILGMIMCLNSVYSVLISTQSNTTYEELHVF